jgi:3-methyl-2-oxobutanoate hydroxymethyltransferase
MNNEFTPKKVRTSSLQEFKRSGRKFACLTSYDIMTAEIFDEAGIDVLLVGDSAADNVLGYESTLPVTVDEMITFGRAVAKGAKRSLVVVDMPFGSYETGVEDALSNGIRILKETGAAAVKLEGGQRSVAQVAALVEAGIPVMGHLGFTPQSVNALGGFKVQGRNESDVDKLKKDAIALQDAGAFAVVFEMIPSQLATEISSLLEIPTIGIGAGSGTDGQILVWTDFAGMSSGKPRKFVRQFAQLRQQLLDAAKTYRTDVESEVFPAPENSFEA